MYGRCWNIVHQCGRLTVNSINRIEACQRWFTKRFKGLFDMRYSERLARLGLESLQVRRLKHDLNMCYKIVHSQLTIQNGDFWCLLITQILEDIVTNYTRVSRMLMHINISLQIVFMRYGIL